MPQIRFDLNLHTDSEFALPDTGRCDRKKFFMILQMKIFLFFSFTLSTRKRIGKSLSLQKNEFTSPLSFILIVSAGRPLFDSQ